MVFVGSAATALLDSPGRDVSNSGKCTISVERQADIDGAISVCHFVPNDGE